MVLLFFYVSLMLKVSVRRGGEARKEKRQREEEEKQKIKRDGGRCPQIVAV